ncbi:MAG: hypothetical protein JWQ71_1895 [Pedosphaera sp.]|nr:hypothetical protein [Pedosphaera sp.]
MLPRSIEILRLRIILLAFVLSACAGCQSLHRSPEEQLASFRASEEKSKSQYGDFDPLEHRASIWSPRYFLN